MGRQTHDMHGKPLWNEHRGQCPRCSSEEREHIRSYSEKKIHTLTDRDIYKYFDWDTYRCKGCGLRYDE